MAADSFSSITNNASMHRGRRTYRLSKHRRSILAHALRIESLESRALLAGDFTIALTNQIEVPEDQTVTGFFAGSLWPSPVAQDATVTMQVLSVDGNPNDNRFHVENNRLVASGNFDYEVSRSHQILIRAEASDGTFGESIVEASIWNGNDNATSPITLSSDFVLENSGSVGVPQAVGQLGVRGGIGQQYELVVGSGDLNNNNFSIVGDTLYLNEIPTRNSVRMYSIRVRATTDSGTIEGVLNVDVNLATPAVPTLLLPINLGGASTVFMQFVENTPIGKTVAVLRIGPSDFYEPFTFTLGGGLAPYFRVEQNHLIVNAAIDYESVINGPIDLSIDATSLVTGNTVSYYQYAYSGNSSGFVLSIIDVNDPPIVADVPDQTAMSGIESQLPLASPLYTDQDAIDQGDLNVAISIDNAPVPWLQWDDSIDTFLVSADAPAGNYTVHVTVTDTSNVSSSGEFNLTITEQPKIDIGATAGNDLIILRALGTAPNSPWRISVNAQTRFEGTIEPGTDVRVNGGTGNDLLRVLAGAGNNQIEVETNRIRIANFWITSNQVEARNLRGQAGADTFIVLAESLANTSLEGGGGPDTVQVDNVAGEWSITDRGSGIVNGAQFSSIRNLLGSDEVDTFSMARNAEITGNIDGRGGVNQIVYAANSRRVETTITSFATLSGVSSQLGGFTNIDNISVLNTANNLLTYTTDNFVNAVDLVLWNLHESSLSIEVRNIFNVVEPVFPDFFYASGYTDLRGAASPDQFFFYTTLQSPVYSLEGGDTSVSSNFVNFPTGPVVVNFQNSTATGILRFANIIQFSLETPGDLGIAIGPNTDTLWDVFADGFFLSDGRSAVNFNVYQGGTGNDIFRFYDTYDAPNAPNVNGGGGRNTLDFSVMSQGVTVDLSTGSAPATSFVSGFSDVIGTPYADTLLGDSLNNRLYGLSGNDTLRGEDGDDILFGGADVDQLFGGSGRDWLLGGSGADSLLGGAGEDLLIGDRGIGFENERDFNYVGLNHAAISLVFAEWTSPRSYLQRIQRLQNGVGPGNIGRLSTTTLEADSEIDSILGNDGNDWFWAELQDLTPDRNNAERVNRL